MPAARRRRDPVLKDFVRTRSGAMRALLQTAEKVLEHYVNTLRLGGSGTGKDFLAEAVHACGKRRGGPFLRIDCAAIPPELFESELFGYEKGTFTDAQSRKLGRLELAQGGSVYFDDITALAPNLQAKLLRAIQEKRFTRLGGNQSVGFDARVITSAADPASLRRDLLYRINVVTLEIPPLRQRAEDGPLLARAFLPGRKRGSDRAAMTILQRHEWTGNWRALRNVIDRAVLVEESDVITPKSLPPLEGDLVATAARRRWTMDQLEAIYTREILRQTRGNYSRAAGILGSNRKTLLAKRRK